jgi:hypothetical protein
MSETTHQPPQAKSSESNAVRRPGNSDLIRARLQKLTWQQQESQKQRKRLQHQIQALDRYLAISGDVTDALEQLSDALFNETLKVLEEKLTIALQEVLGQPIKFCAKAGFKNSSAVVEFAIDRDGNQEDAYRGQGGSVQNVLSVGLRMFALATLDPVHNRRFLVLDEQDCWLRAELVPQLVRIVFEASRELGFQVIMISHHDSGLFDRYADRIYRFIPNDHVVRVEEVGRRANQPDAEPIQSGNFD